MKKILLIIVTIASSMFAGFFSGEGTIIIEANQGMNLIIDGKRRGATGTSTKLKLDGGKHTIEVQGFIIGGALAGAEVYDKKEVDIGDGMETTIRMNPQIIKYPERQKEKEDNKYKTNQEDTLFKQVPLIEDDTNKKDSFEEMVKHLKEKEEKEQGIKKTDTQTKTIKAVPSGVYIEVGATSKIDIGEDLKKKIIDNGLNFEIMHTSVNGKTICKALVGPYKSTSEAKIALEEIKKTINKDAFIYRVK